MHTRARRLLLRSAVPVAMAVSLSGPRAAGPDEAGPPFRTSHLCLSCHNGLVSPAGRDLSIGADWRAGMMANASRDPYWQAGVRREMRDHPASGAAIEDECSICHMPMATVWQRATAGHAQIFAHLAGWLGATPLARLAHDGVSCTVCHQVSAERLGTRESFTGGFVVRSGELAALGPYEVVPGLSRIMESATGFRPTAAPHVQQSELCATCHTLFTHTLDGGEPGATLPEQVPYLEWRHSAYAQDQSCQSCHMPVAGAATPITAVLGQPREHFSQHTFLGGNFVVPRLLNVHRAELGTEAPPQEIDSGISRTLEHLHEHAARVRVTSLEVREGTLTADVLVESLAGHKLPTAYPSRRAWLHVTVTDGVGARVFESGRLDPSGLIEGNDNDADGGRIEPHYREIRAGGEVQIYEAIMGDAGGNVTTGLLSAVRFLKDNRLLPRGFDKTTAPADVAVHGSAAGDQDFAGGGDRVRYHIRVGDARGPLTVSVELLYQPIAWRWARNLAAYDAPETKRFARYFDGLAGETATRLAHAERAR
jgi:hypothetical protein